MAYNLYPGANVTPAMIDVRLRRVVNWAKAGGVTPANIATEFTNFATTLGTDTTTHDGTIQAPPASLRPQHPPPK